MMRNFALAVAGLISLSACASGSGSAVLQPLPAALAGNARITAVQLSNAPTRGVSGEFEQIFESRVQAKLDGCAQGQQPLTLEINLDTFDRANAAMTWLLADENLIAGVAVLRDASGATVGEYVIKRTFVASGLVGIALMAQAEEQMSNAFGEELCKQAFGDD